MPPKKFKPVGDDQEFNFDNYLSKSFGKAFVTETPQIDFVPTRLANVDRALGGGIPRGRLIELYGDPSSGKTSFSLHLSREVCNEDKFVLYFDLESCLAGRYLESFGLPPSRFKLIQPIEEPISAEKLFKQIEEMTMMLGSRLGLVVVDSIPCLITEKEAEDHEDGSASSYSPTANFLSKNLKYLVPLIARSATAMLCINQQSSVIGSRVPLKSTMGGWRFKYFCSQRLHIARVARPEYNTSDRVTVQIRTEKNKVGDPFRQAQFDIVFGRGPDLASALLQECLANGYLIQKSSWISFSPELAPVLAKLGIDRPNLAQGAERAAKELADNQDLFDALYKLSIGEPLRPDELDQDTPLDA